MTVKAEVAHLNWSSAESPQRITQVQSDAAASLTDDESLQALAERTAVAHIMSRGVVCIAADAGLERVANMLLERNLGSIPVVDAAWRPVGVIDRTDLLWSLSQPSSRRGEAGAQGAPKTAGALAQSVVLTLHETSSVSAAAGTMGHEGIHRLPVVNAAGQIVGVVSSLDIVAWVARCTGEAILPADS